MSLTNNNNPCAGVDIALACVAVIMVVNPDVVELTSNFADATGVTVPVPTFEFVP